MILKIVYCVVRPKLVDSWRSAIKAVLLFMLRISVIFSLTVRPLQHQSKRVKAHNMPSADIVTTSFASNFQVSCWNHQLIMPLHFTKVSEKLVFVNFWRFTNCFMIKDSVFFFVKTTFCSKCALHLNLFAISRS